MDKDRAPLGDLEHTERHRDFGYCRCIKVEVKCTIRISRGRAKGLDEILVEFGKACMEWLIGLFNVIFKTGKMSIQFGFMSRQSTTKVINLVR